MAVSKQAPVFPAVYATNWTVGTAAQRTPIQGINISGIFSTAPLLCFTRYANASYNYASYDQLGCIILIRMETGDFHGNNTSTKMFGVKDLWYPKSTMTLSKVQQMSLGIRI